jgi:AbrB family looped-hinge helix DNA binding protein
MTSKFTVIFNDIKNRVTIPKQIRKIENIQPGDVLEVTIENKTKKKE